MRRSLIALPIALAAILATGPAQAGSKTDRATGGGQILVSTSESFGSTIAFTAQGTAQTGKGQVQVVDRAAGTGQDQVKFHGVVDCVDVQGNAAEIIGHNRNNAADLFSLYVMDNGEGAAAANDVIFFTDQPADQTCGLDSDDDDSAVDLARGNAQVYDAA